MNSGRRFPAVLVRCTALVGMLVACSPFAFALNPALTIGQYAHTAWRSRDGFTEGVIQSIAQTQDGYLWLGTSLGLLRFDGVRATSWRPASGELPSANISRLLTSADGTLWIGTSRGLASMKDGRVTQYPRVGEQRILRLAAGTDGVVWVGVYGSQTGRLCTVSAGAVECFGADGIFGRGPFGLLRDRMNRIWAGGLGSVWRWSPAPFHSYSVPGEAAANVRGLIDDDRGLLVSLRSGIRRLENGLIGQPIALPPRIAQAEANELLRDRDGGLWIGTSGGGIARMHNGGIELFGQSDGLSSDRVGALFEDREGSIWVGTADGLDRFRQYAVTRITTREGLSGSGVRSVLARKDGSVWVATDAGLSRWHDGRIADVDSARPNDRWDDGGTGTALFQDNRDRLWVANFSGVDYQESGRWVSVSGLPRGRPFTVTQDSAGNIWISYQVEGLVRISPAGAIQTFPWSRFGPGDPAISMLADPRAGGLLLGFPRGGIIHFADEEIRASYGAANGVGPTTVNDLRFDSSGMLWAATESGLMRLKDGRGTTMSVTNGLPCDAVNWVIEDDARSLWLQLPCGLVRIARAEVDAWNAAMDRSPRPTHALRVDLFDAADGARSFAGTAGVRPLVTKSSDGRLWFRGVDGMNVIDPNQIARNPLPPLVAIEQLVADRRRYGDDAAATGSRIALPARTRDLHIDYTALSFVAPEKVRFRYRLENYDGNWQDVGARRQAFYNDLPPGAYRFSVIAANNSGVWNEAGASIDFSIAPAYYQTAWFRLAVLTTILGAIVVAHRRRVRQIARDFNIRLDERVNERTRIARDLHDTLLQSFQAVLIHFQAATRLLPGRPDEARQKLESVLDQAARAVSEGRDAVQALRESAEISDDLPRELRLLVDDLNRADVAAAPAIHVNVEGSPRRLHPIVSHDVFRIASEAMRNAVRHAQARVVQVDVHYDAKSLQLRIRDDGKGIDAAILVGGGGSGHWGLPGMRERAQVIGGTLDVRSRVGSGTEVELRLPASKAYAAPQSRRRVVPRRDQSEMH